MDDTNSYEDDFENSDLNHETKSVASRTSKGRRKKKKRPLNIEEVFATISPIRAHDSNPKGPPRIILTPRSAESCLRQGVNPVNILIRDLDSFWEPGVDAAVQHMRHESYSQIRHEHMKIAREERVRIIETESAAPGTGNESKSISDPSSQKKKKSGVKEKLKAESEAKKSSLIKQEQARLVKVQKRQQKEIEQMLAYELKTSNIAKDAERKMLKEQRLAEARERARQKRKKVVAEERRQKQLQRRAEEDIEERNRRELAQKSYLKEQDIEEQRKEKERQIRVEAREHEEMRIRKAEEHKKQTERIFKDHQDQIATRLQEMEENEIIREQLMEEKNLKSREEMERKRAMVEKRMIDNKRANKLIQKRKKEEFHERQRQSEERRQRLEAKRAEELEEERRIREITEHRRLMALKETNEKREAYKEELINHHHEVDIALDRIREEKERQHALKKERSKLIKEQRLANVERQKRIDEYKRLQTLKKLHEIDSRTHHLVKGKADLIEERKRASIRAKLRKDKVITAMNEIRLSKKWDLAEKKLKAISQDDSKKKKKKKRNKSSSLSRDNDYDELPRISSAEESMMSRTALDGVDNEPTSYMSPYEMPLDKPRKTTATKQSETAYSHIPTFATEDERLVTF